MIRSLTRSLLIAASLTLAAPAYSAGFVKLGDIKGESTDAGHAAPQSQAQGGPVPATPAAPGQRVQGNQTPQPASLLLPAVQKPRAALAPGASAPQSGPSKKKGNVEYNWKIEKGEK